MRGKYFARYQADPPKVVRLDPDVAVAFPTEAAVNAALTEAVRRKKTEGLTEFFGSGLWQGNLSQMREDRPRKKAR